MTINQICILCPMNTSLLFLIHLYVLSFKLGLNKFQAVQVAIATFYRLWTNPVSAMHSLINILLKEQTSKYCWQVHRRRLNSLLAPAH